MTLDVTGPHAAADGDSSSQNPSETTPRKQGTLVDRANSLPAWRDQNGRPYVTLPNGDNVQVESSALRSYLTRWAHTNDQARRLDHQLQEATDLLEAKAISGFESYTVFHRVAKSNDRIYIDLYDQRRQVVEISCDGWRVTTTPPVRFVRSAAMRHLPVPSGNTPLSELWRLLGIRSTSTQKLLTSWLLSTLRGTGPFPLLMLNGRQGSGKTMLTRILSELIDPSVSAAREPIRNDRDLKAAALNSFLLSFDNMSSVRGNLSDALCRVATGAALGGRKLYSDSEEVIATVCRPIIINGIPSLANRSDLAERAIQVELESRTPSDRRTEADLWAEFETLRPGILGTLYTALAHGLASESDLGPIELPRMADAMRFATAAETALGYRRRELLEAFNDRQHEAIVDNLATEPVAEGIRKIIASGPFEGTASSLLDRLETLNAALGGALPRSARALSTDLKRLEPSLAAIGIAIKTHRTANERSLRIEQLA